MANYERDDMADIVRNLDTDIRQSWVRCLNSYQMNPGAKIQPTVLTKNELAEQAEPLDDLLALAGPEVKRLFARLADSDYLVSVASPEGVKIFYRCDYHMISKMEKLGVASGSKWSEEIQGTNGVGTCIQLKKPISVIGSDHFFNDIKNLSCSVVPVFGPQNRLECVLNTTTSRPTDKNSQKVLRTILMRSALRIENRYFARHYPHARVVRLSLHDDFADPANELRIAIGQNGEILDATSPISSALNLDREQVLGRNLDEVLGSDLDLSPGSAPQSMHLEFPEQKLVYAKVDEQQRVVEHPYHRLAPPTAKSGRVIESALPDEIDQSVFREHPGLASELPKAIRAASAGLPLVLTGEVGSGREDLAKLLAAKRGDQGFRTVRCELESHDTVARCLTDPNLKGTLYLDNADQLPEHLRRAVTRRISSGTKSAMSSQLSFVLGRLEAPTEARKVQDGLLDVGMTLHVPPLREYPNRVRVIEKMFGQEKRTCEADDSSLAPETLSLLAEGLWPGNFDQLRLVLRHAIAMCDTTTILPEDLPESAAISQPDGSVASVEEGEKQTYQFALELNGWNVSRTAKYLGVSRATLNRKIRAHKIERPAKTAESL